ncbi:thermonuclease family protein [Peribacillus sp. B-H-3]|uniref:thermonuclease family protein n=1 Tax=Peribacillus sp. B-H-3 TaxID=3400420 RepID=UPI003B01CF0D
MIKTFNLLFTAGTLSALLLSGCSGTEYQGSRSEPSQQEQKSSVAPPETNAPANSKKTAEVQEHTKKGRLPAAIVRAIDGDTVKIKLNGRVETVRMLCVDTPETHHPRLGVQPFGLEAAQFTKKILYSGRKIEIEPGINMGRDKYGRLLGYIYTDGKMFNETLLEKGLARVAYIYPPNTKYTGQFYAIQKKAQQKRAGIWSLENYATDKGFDTNAAETALDKKGTSRAAHQNSKPSVDHSLNRACDIKGNISSSGTRIYHLPGQHFYNATKPEKMFCTENEAVKAGFRKSQQ